ncbi:MAG: Uma2 family endonuclease [Aquificaceae bacterium]|nr:Uma2 family endonuclease [Aquificaceae bacterium]
MGLAEKYPVRYTVKDWERWQGDWELVEGVPYAMASPRPINQRLLARITRILDTMFDNCPNCGVYVELDWYISGDTIVRPDLLVFCGEVPEKLEDKPEMVIEIVSPSSKAMDEGLKFELYQEQKVPYFVLVYPEDKTFVVYELKDRKYVLKEDRKFYLKGCELELDFTEVFYGLV